MRYRADMMVIFGLNSRNESRSLRRGPCVIAADGRIGLSRAEVLRGHVDLLDARLPVCLRLTFRTERVPAF